MRRKEKGFTLMELMVVIVIVAILAAVAVPLYINYVKDAQRTEAKGAIGAIITAEQTYLQRYNEYKTCPSVTTDCLGVDLSDLATNWDFKVTATGGTSFKAEATGKGKMLGLCVSCLYTRGGTPAPDWLETCATAPSPGP